MKIFEFNRGTYVTQNHVCLYVQVICKIVIVCTIYKQKPTDMQLQVS